MTRLGDQIGSAESARQLGEIVEAGVEEIERAILEAKLQDDPMRFPLRALASYLRALQRLYCDAAQTLAKIVEEIRQPLDQAAIVDRLGREAGRVMNAHAQQFLSQARRRTLLTAAGVLVGLSALCLGGGYWWGSVSTAADIQRTEAGLRAALASDPEGAKIWLSLMKWNDPRKALAQCQGQRVVQQAGRHGCDVPLWIEALPGGVTQ